MILYLLQMPETIIMVILGKLLTVVLMYLLSMAGQGKNLNRSVMSATIHLSVNNGSLCSIDIPPSMHRALN